MGFDPMIVRASDYSPEVKITVDDSMSNDRRGRGRNVTWEQLVFCFLTHTHGRGKQGGCPIDRDGL